MKIPGFDDEDENKKNPEDSDGEFFEQEEFHDDEDEAEEKIEEETIEELIDENELTLEEKKDRLSQLIFEEFPQAKIKEFSAISGSVIGDKTQPLVLLSEADFEHHHLYLGHASLRFPTKALPYMIEALQTLYEMNGSKHFDTSKSAANLKAFKDHTTRDYDDSLVTFHSLDDLIKSKIEESNKEYKEFAKKHNINEEIFDEGGGISEKANKAIKEAFMKMDIAEKIEFIKKAAEIKRKIYSIKDNIDADPFLSELEKETLKEQAKEKLAESMSSFEQLVRGAVKNELIKEETPEEAYARISKILDKNGEMAAKEELYRIPEGVREIVLQKIVENIEKNRK